MIATKQLWTAPAPAAVPGLPPAEAAPGATPANAPAL
ncbi:MAG: hypothetical protein BWX68_00878 [Verrucomicrobia bacterium ADurb.Bin063]|nr:MAG: hypothetical protein BWX68_00878 [Verrucomicrobia bacterium ADurb.Bin063]